jgi:DNA-binding PadR family transcriptional regulator
VRVRHLILGLLTHEPMSGYDIKQLLERFSWLIGSPSFGSLYPTLHSSLEEGLVTVEVIPREDQIPRKIYTITGAGRRRLQEWIDQPAAPDTHLKAFVTRLILADNLSARRLAKHLEQRRSQVADHRMVLKQATDKLDRKGDQGQYLALDYGLALADAELAWLDRTLERLSGESLPLEVLEGNSTTSTV